MFAIYVEKCYNKRIFASYFSFRKEAYMAKVKYDSKGRVLPKGITEVGDNKYKVRFMFHGKKYCETVVGLSKAKRTLEDMKFKGRRNLIQEDTMTINEWFDICLELKKIQENTKQQYKMTWNKWMRDTLGKKMPSQITRLEIKCFFQEATKSLGQGSIKTLHSLLSNVLEEALCENPLRKNPCTNVLKDLKYKQSENVRQKALTEQQQDTFIKYLDILHDPYREFYIVLFYTGMRISELAALARDAIDFENGFIEVKRALKRVNHKFVISEPKCGSIRLIPMLPIVKEALEQRISIIESKMIHCKVNEDLLFFSPKGGYITSSTLLDHTKSIVKKIPEEVNDFTNHAMRHSFATRLMENNVNENYIALAMGHKDIATTRKSYVNLDVDKEKLKNNILKAEIGKIIR